MDARTIARQLRFAMITNALMQGLLDEPSAKELLAGPLSPGDDSTIVDDSGLLGDPDALNKIAADTQSPTQSLVMGSCAECHKLVSADSLKQDPYPGNTWLICPACYRHTLSIMGSDDA